MTVAARKAFFIKKNKKQVLKTHFDQGSFEKLDEFVPKLGSK